jgi:DNA-binding CsgD family transcriptional regulator
VNQNDLSLFVLDTIENPMKRHEFVATFAEIIGASAAGIAVEDRQQRWASLCVTHGIDRVAIDSYCQHYAALNPYALRLPGTPGEVRKSEELLSEAEFRETEFYHGLFKPRNWGHASGVILETTETEQAYLFGIRPPNHPFTEKEMATLKGLAPLLVKATRLQRLIMAQQNEIDHLRSGALQIDALTRLGLSLIESRIALAIAQGQTTKEYASKTGLSVATVKWHVQRIYKKLGVRSRAALRRLLQEILPPITFPSQPVSHSART